MKVSIIIAVKKDNKFLRQSIRECLKLDYPDFEICVFPDEQTDLPPSDKVRVIPTGAVDPAGKRDLALTEARGEILAFLDDDAYPVKDWLKNAISYFKRADCAAVGGPAVTPDSDSIRQVASGLVYSSFFVSGSHRRRYIPTTKTVVDDYPSCNFIIRKAHFEKVGGFDTAYWPGEDTILCLKVTKDLRKKIIYDPDVLVYHHRRALYIPHLKQIKSYAVHRGYFVKKYPATSFRLTFFLPTIFTLGLLAGAICSLFSVTICIIYIVGISFYLACCGVAAFKKGRPRMGLLVFSGIALTHLTYGIWFIKGLISKGLSRNE